MEAGAPLKPRLSHSRPGSPNLPGGPSQKEKIARGWVRLPRHPAGGLPVLGRAHFNENPKLVNLGESALAPCVADKGQEIPQLR